MTTMEVDDGSPRPHTSSSTSLSSSFSPSALPSTRPSSSSSSPSSNPIFDLESYIARYAPQSETRLQRLIHIARHAPDEEVSRLAFALAERQCHDLGNVKKYREVFGPNATGSGGSGAGGSGSGSGSGGATMTTQAGSGSGESASEQRHTTTSTSTTSTSTHEQSSSSSAANHADHLITATRHPSTFSFPYDTSWANAADQSAHVQLETLEARLSTAQTRLVKDAIRTAYLALGDFHRSRGDLKKALWCVLRSREYCANSKQIGQVSLMVIELGIDSKNYGQARDYVTKAQHTSDLHSTDALFSSKLKAASAILSLSEGKYENAARKLTSASPELTNQFNTVLSAEDIALYGTLLGLATFARSELRTHILNSSAFRGRLELIPPLRDALHYYVRAEYGACLSLLGTVRSELMLDLHLSQHVDTLYGLIRDRCIVQYFDPYEAVSVGVMAKCFDMTVDDMMKVIADLIKTGKIRGARLNCLTKTLRGRGGGGTRDTVEKRRRRETRRRVARLGERFLSETEAMILRLSCLENDLIVQSGKSWRSRGGMGGLDEAFGTRGTHMHRFGGGGGRSRGRGGVAHMMYDVDESSDEDDDDDDDEGIQIGGRDGGEPMMMDMDVVHGSGDVVNPEEV